MNLYSSLNGFVSTKEWNSHSQQFRFKKGIFQGDPLSPIIFLLCFNPIIEVLSENSRFGYELDGQKLITAPFADDFCLITGNKRTHQRLMNTISSRTSSLGLKLKQRKCRTLSISGGSPTDLKFHLDNIELETLKTEEFKFLGSLVSYDNSSDDKYQYVKSMIEVGVTNIDKALVRNEFKLKVFADYFLPSLRFHLTVNELTDTHLKLLDALCNRYLKKMVWPYQTGHVGLPSYARMS